MSKEEDNKAVVGRWFTEFWGKNVNLAVVDEIAAADMLLKYSLHEPRRGRDDIKAFMTDFRSAFPDLNFWGTADLIADGDYVVGQWEGGGTHNGPDALHRHHGAEGDQRQDHEGDRPRRRRDRADPTWADQSRLIEAGRHLSPPTGRLTLRLPDEVRAPPCGPHLLSGGNWVAVPGILVDHRTTHPLTPVSAAGSRI
jgi:hypothetical protein